MSKFYRLGLLVVVCAILLGVVFQFSPAQDKAQAVQKWEYKSAVVVLVSDFEKDISSYGNEGWELAWIMPPDAGRSYQVAIFKRPK